MYGLFNSNLKYLLLIPIALMIVFILLYQFIFAEIHDHILNGKITEGSVVIEIEDDGYVVVVEYDEIYRSLFRVKIVLTIQIVITFLVNMAFVWLLSYLGIIYKSRKGPKWRTRL